MSATFLAITFSACLFAAMVLALEAGHRLRQRRQRADPDGAIGGAAVDGGVLALLGLLLAFSFTGAATRFETRRHLAVEEANAVGTAWLRLDLLPAEDQPAVRAAMRSYVDARMRVHRALPDVGAALAAHREVAVLQQQVWSLARAAVERDGRPNVAVLVVPALNAMFDIGTSRVAALRAHLPTPILVLLFLAAILAAVLAGFGMWSPEDGIGCTSSSSPA